MWHLEWELNLLCHDTSPSKGMDLKIIFGYPFSYLWHFSGPPLSQKFLEMSVLSKTRNSLHQNWISWETHIYFLNTHLFTQLGCRYALYADDKWEKGFPASVLRQGWSCKSSSVGFIAKEEWELDSRGGTDLTRVMVLSLHVPKKDISESTVIK